MSGLRQPALLASLTEPVPVSALSGNDQAQFTPGPWIAEPADMFGDHNIVLADDSEDARAIAAVVSNLRPQSEVAANACLIAAAPELAEALDAMATRFAAYVEAFGLLDDRDDETMAFASIALAKVTGGTA